jgi:hypothetical protein
VALEALGEHGFLAGRVREAGRAGLLLGECRQRDQQEQEVSGFQARS